MTLEELRLRVQVIADSPVGEFTYPDGSVCLSFEGRVGPMNVFWGPEFWEPWALGLDSVAEALRQSILSVTAHDIITARRRLQGAEPCSAPTT